jgi:hypothetical protein
MSLREMFKEEGVRTLFQTQQRPLLYVWWLSEDFVAVNP